MRIKNGSLTFISTGRILVSVCVISLSDSDERVKELETLKLKMLRSHPSFWSHFCSRPREELLHFLCIRPFHVSLSPVEMLLRAELAQGRSDLAVFVGCCRHTGNILSP